MRKTRLVILPTKCLNQMGFLLLFLSCPVIGDWGRIRPDSEMLQWSILIEKEGSCGLVRNPVDEKDPNSEKLKQCLAYNEQLMNNTLPTQTVMNNSVVDHQSRTYAAVFASEAPQQRATAPRRVTNIRRIRMTGGRLRMESEDRSVRREMRLVAARDIKGKRRDASERGITQAGNAHRKAGRLNRTVSPQRLLRRTYQEKSIRSIDNRRTENQKIRLNVQTRENRIREKNQDRNYLFTRKMTSALREREGNERREKINFERTFRRIDNVQSRRSTNEIKARELMARTERRQSNEARWARRLLGNDRRIDDVQNRKLTNYDVREMQTSKNDENLKRVNNQQRMSRRMTPNNERIHMAERRHFIEERRIQNEERRLSNIRKAAIREREVMQNRRDETLLGRSPYTKRHTETREVQREKSRIGPSNSARQRRPTSRKYSQRISQPQVGNRRELENTRNNRQTNDEITTRLSIRENDEKSGKGFVIRKEINRERIRERSSLIRKERSIDNRQMRERRNDLMHTKRRAELNQSRKITEQRGISAGILTKGSRDAERYFETAAVQRGRTGKMEKMVQRDQLETLAPEVKMEKAESPEQWKFLENTMRWIGLKNYQEPHVTDYKDFTTTCLFGAALFFLTTRPIKGV